MQTCIAENALYRSFSFDTWFLHLAADVPTQYFLKDENVINWLFISHWPLKVCQAIVFGSGKANYWTVLKDFRIDNIAASDISYTVTAHENDKICLYWVNIFFFVWQRRFDPKLDNKGTVQKYGFPNYWLLLALPSCNLITYSCTINTYRCYPVIPIGITW